jgi:hypothetical protein
MWHGRGYALATVNIEPAFTCLPLKHTNKYHELFSTSGMMDNITCKYNPDCITDDIIANSERDVLIFQPPRDISLTGELNRDDRRRAGRALGG